MARRPDRTLERAAFFLIVYAVLDVFLSIGSSGTGCDHCTAAELSRHKVLLISGFAVDLLVVACAYFGARGQAWGFVVDALVLGARTVVAVLDAAYFSFLLDLFFLYWPVSAAIACMRRDRQAALVAAIRALQSRQTEPDEPVL